MSAWPGPRTIMRRVVQRRGEQCRGQRAGGGGASAGAGNGVVPAAGATPAAGAGFRFLTIFWAMGFADLAGCSSPTTGLGSTEVDAGVVKSPGTRVTCTGIVSGRYLLSV